MLNDEYLESVMKSYGDMMQDDEWGKDSWRPFVSNIYLLIIEIKRLKMIMAEAHARISRDIYEPDKIFIHLSLLNSQWEQERFIGGKEKNDAT